MRALFLAVLFASQVAQAADAPAIEPKALAARLARSPQIAIFQVGFGYLYRANHIPGSVYAGPGSRQAGLDLLKAAAAKLPHDREIVVYCGCCPWDKCPNIKPTIDLLKAMGFTHVTALHLSDNFKADWVDRGYPAAQGETSQ